MTIKELAAHVHPAMRIQILDGGGWTAPVIEEKKAGDIQQSDDNFYRLSVIQDFRILPGDIKICI